MKTNYFTLVFLLSTVFVFAQNNDFNNQGVDLLWSNDANWSQEVAPNTANTSQVRMPLTVESMVDQNISIKKIQTTFATGGDVPIAGSGTLTIDPGVDNQQGIENVSNNDIKLIFKGNVNINNSAGDFTLMRSLNGNSNSINFDDGSTLTLTTDLGVISAASPSFNFNGSIDGAGNLRFGSNTVNTFGSTSSNLNWTGELVFLGNAQAIVNTADNNTFFSGSKIQVNGNSASIEINGANVFSSDIVVGGNNTFTFNANANQNNLEQIIFQNSGTLNLAIDNTVTDLSFADNSASPWNSGTLNITGFKEGIIRFGIDNNGLTAQQLTQITADNNGKTLTLDANGYLVNVPDYTYSGGSWSPLNPVGVSTSTDNIFIENGSVDISSTLTANNVRVASAATLNVAPEGVLDLSGDIINGGNLVFQSDVTSTTPNIVIESGQLDEFNGSIIGSGDITVERFIPGKRAFRFLASPITTTDFIFENWQKNGSNPTSPDGLGTHITGGSASDGFDQSGTNNPSMFTFDNTFVPAGAQTQSDAWSSLPNTNATKLNAGEAYLTMVRGDRTIDLTSNASTPNNTTLSAKGDLFTGTNSPVLSNGPELYSLVANPYQAVVDYSLVSKTDLTDFIYIWDASIGGNNGNGGYVTVEVSSNSITDPNTTTSDASKFIAPGMSFFVQNPSIGTISPSLTFEEDDKATGADQVTVFNSYPHFYINSRLYLTSDLQNGNSERDAVGLRFSDNFTTFGSDEDATKLGNPDENFAIVNNGLRSIDKQGLPNLGDEIDLSITNYTETNYSLTFVMENKPQDLGVFLKDEYLDTETELTETFVYDFTVDSNIPESMAENRFSLIFDNTTLGINENTFGENFSLYPNPTKGQFSIKTPNISGEVNVEITNLLGQQVSVQKLSIEGQQVNVNAENLSTGVYVVKLSQGSQDFNLKLVVK